jgi:hypothetical protein
MASNYTGLGIQLMTTGEKAGTWGTLTNTNWDIIEQISGGYIEQDIAGGAGTTTLSVSDGSTGATLAHRIIKLTGSITGNRIVTIPLDVQTFYIITNGTTDGAGTPTVEFKYVTGSGSSVTWAASDKGTKIIYAAADDGTNPNIIDTGFMANVVDDTSPQLGGNLDVNGNTITSTSDGNIALAPNGTGEVVVGSGSSAGDITTSGTQDLILDTNAGTNSGNITITDGANGNITLSPNGTGEVQAVDAADATGAVKIAGLETIFIPAQAMFGTTTNGADAQAVETTATRPELKVLDFDASTAEYAQFSIAMPKSWNLGTVTYQVFWSPGNTNTDNCIFGLQGLACTEGDTADAVFGTAVEVTDAGIGTVEDVQMTAVSGAVTIAGTPADDDYCFFQLYRDAADGSDTFTGDARVLGIKLFYTTDAANDA